MTLRRDRLWRNRLTNALQTLLIMGGLALSLSVPGYLLAGPGGVLISLTAVAFTSLLSSWMPVRVILTDAGAGMLRRHQAPELYEVLAHLYARADLPIAPQLFFVPSPDLNAFAVGTWRDGGIAVTEGLLHTLSMRELAGVLAHETSHLRHGDTRVMSMAAAMTRLTLWLTVVVQVALLASLPLVAAGELAFPWGPLLLVAVAPTLSTLLSLALSRNREYKADLEAVALTGDPEGLASALTELERYHSRWLSTIFGRQQQPTGLDWLRTHPPTAERIQRLFSIDGQRHGLDPHPGLQRHHGQRPRVHQRPGALGGHHWFLRRRR
ncbi:zinc metalloprotease HtpX [Halomonas maura]|uniref:zinc metalloprotease HtpX n=1 Tax=Halomonas maura TaxID=117606 RepID=UPI0025B3890A|nr:zinc metalloprotease HtpX [Halomonas maura]MDN3557708.1 zinc metalloprotease HtpX [Halomonas maura]